MQNAYTWMLMILRKAHISTNTCLHQGFGSIARAHRITTDSAPQFATAQRMYVKLQNDYRASVEEVVINVVSTTRRWGGWRLWR